MNMMTGSDNSSDLLLAFTRSLIGQFGYYTEERLVKAMEHGMANVKVFGKVNYLTICEFIRAFEESNGGWSRTKGEFRADFNRHHLALHGNMRWSPTNYDATVESLDDPELARWVSFGKIGFDPGEASSTGLKLPTGI